MGNVCDCKSLNDGSIPSSAFIKKSHYCFFNLFQKRRMQSQMQVNIFNSSVVEPMAVNHRVAGSNPA